MTDSERQILIARLRERADVMEASDWIRPDDWQLLRDAALAFASCPTVEQREQALEWAESSGQRSQAAELTGLNKETGAGLLKRSNRDMQIARRLLGLAPTGE